MTMGSSVQWYSIEEANKSSFPEFIYGIEFNEENCEKVTIGEWTWETGMNLNQVYEFERIRAKGDRFPRNLFVGVLVKWQVTRSKAGIMRLGILSGVISSLIMAFLPFTLFSGLSQPADGDYWSMSGILIEHHFTDSLNPHSDQMIFELQDNNGLPLWFGRYIFKDVCISGLCRMVSIWLFWDGAGNYLGIQLIENELLTKSDHEEFEPEDYAKLNSLLRDPNSILRDKKPEDLTLKPVSDNPFEVDGYSGATQPSLLEVVVEDAVYTCHTLWHTVYGPTRDKIMDVLEERVGKEYLKLMFESGNPDFVIWGIRSVEQFPEYHESFYGKILENISSGHELLYEEAIGYFRPDRMNDKVVQLSMVNMIPELSSQKKYDMIWKFIETEQVYGEVVEALLEFFQNNDVGIGTLNLIYRLINAGHMANNQNIYRIVRDLAEHENAYVRNITKRFINSD